MSSNENLKRKYEKIISRCTEVSRRMSGIDGSLDSIKEYLNSGKSWFDGDENGVPGFKNENGTSIDYINDPYGETLDINGIVKKIDKVKNDITQLKSNLSKYKTDTQTKLNNLPE